MRLHILLVSALTVHFLSPSLAFADRSLNCESENNSYTHCPVRLGRDARVELNRKLSDADCKEGRSWGVDRSGIWVDGGCRASFRISYDDRRNDDYYDRSGDDRFGDGGRGHGRYDRDDNDGYDRRREVRRRMRELERENQRLKEERAQKHQCPAGARYGRCSDSERAKGCKDWKTDQGVPCKKGG